MNIVISSVNDLGEGFALDELLEMPLPHAVLMCPPDEFDVVDVKNPFMETQVGKVDRTVARKQWDELKARFERIGLVVKIIPPVEGCEDMVFCANQTFPGMDGKGDLLCVLSHMRHPSRQKEVPAFKPWYEEYGYQVQEFADPSLLFEGCGDALWHPGRALIWGGYGWRTQKEIYAPLSKCFDAPVVTLQLVTDHYYHLDTCFCPVNSRTVLIYPPAFTEQGLALINRLFPDVIPVSQYEAASLMACNAAAFFGKHVVLQRGAVEVNKALKDRGFEVHEVDTNEFMKSGGSVFCMKMNLF